MGRSSSKLTPAPSFDQIKSVKKSVDIRKKNIPINSLNKPLPVEERRAPSNDESSIRLVENMILVWLDISSEKQTDANKKTIDHFYRLINIIHTFTDLEKCFHFLNSVKRERILFVVSGSFGPQILPRVDDFEQIYSIYIFCGNRSNHLEWTQPFKKIHGIHTQIKDLCDALRYDNSQFDKSLTAISILPSTKPIELNQSNKQFIYLQMMKSILLEIQYDRRTRQELTDFARPFYLNNRHQLSIIDPFHENYQLHSSIWWYTRKCFIYRMLRTAFHEQDFELIYKLAFYIRDLHREIKKAYLQAHSHQYHPISVYRAACITNAEFENLEANYEGLLSFNDFVIGTLERSIALRLAQKLRNDANLVAIIYKLDVDPTNSSIPFIALNNLTYLTSTNGEILLSMNTIFHIDLIEKVYDRLYEITLSPASKKDEQISNLVDYMQKITCGLTGWYKLSKIMMYVKEYDQVEQIYKYINSQTPESQHAERAYLFHELGYLYDLKNNLPHAIFSYQQALRIYLSYLSAEHPTLLSTYTNLADALKRQGDLNGALEQYQHALRVKTSNDMNEIIQYNNIGTVLQQQGKHLDAQHSYEKAMKDLLQNFPSNQQILADTYHNLGGLFYLTKDYFKALNYYEKTLAIEEKILPLNHSALASIYFNLSTTHEARGESMKAMDYAEKSVEIACLAFGNEHSQVKENRNYLEQLREKSSALRS